MSVLNKPAQLLEDGWCWVEYDDGSGHLENPNGKSVISYDYTTQEYRDVHGNWKFMNNYPDTTSWKQFKTDTENIIVAEGLASYNDLVNSIATFRMMSLSVGKHMKNSQKSTILFMICF